MEDSYYSIMERQEITEQAKEHVLEMMDQGAGIIDLFKSTARALAIITNDQDFYDHVKGFLAELAPGAEMAGTMELEKMITSSKAITERRRAYIEKMEKAIRAADRLEKKVHDERQAFRNALEEYRAAVLDDAEPHENAQEGP